MNIEALGLAAAEIFTPYNLIIMAGASILGMFVGAMPGMSSVMGLALLLPFTFKVKGYTGIMMLLSLWCSAVTGGSISATLLNTPGTANSAATCLESYPLAVKKRQPGRALGICVFSSLCGGIFGCVALICGAPLLSKIALSFKSPEYFSLALFGICILTGVSGKSVMKGCMGGLLGLLVATVGLDPFTAVNRFTFGSIFLTGGISLIPVLIGTFALSQALYLVETCYNESPIDTKFKIDRVFPSKPDLKLIGPTILRSSVIGTAIGAIPGTGGDIASWVGYNEAKRWSKHKEDFGNGAPEGIAGSEAANNAIVGGAMVPLLSLGIPGDAGSALLLSTITMMGIHPGPKLMTETPVQAYLIFVSLLVANVFMGIFAFMLIRPASKIILVPNKYIAAVIITFCITGTYAVNRSIEEVFVMLISGVIGYLLIKLDFAMAPITLGLVLGTLAEENARRGLDLFASGNSVWDHPIAIVFVLLSFVSLFSPLIMKAVEKKANAKEAANAAAGETKAE